MSAKTSLVILKNITPSKISSHYARRTSEALDLLRAVAFKSNGFSADSPNPEIITSIKKMKNDVRYLRTDFHDERYGYVTPKWNPSPTKALERIGLNQNQIEALAPILPNKTSHTRARTLENELIPQILFTLKTLDEHSFEDFLDVIQHYPSVGVMVCEILCDDNILEKAQPFSDQKSFEHKRENLFQTLKENPNHNIAVFPFVAVCNEHGKNIAPDKWQITLKHRVSSSDVSVITEFVSKYSTIPGLNLYAINSESVAVLRDGLSNSSVKIRKLDISRLRIFRSNDDINDRGWGIVGEIVKKHKVEELDLHCCGLTFEKLNAFNKSSEDCKIRKLNFSGNRNIDDRGWGIVGEFVKKHGVEELDFGACDLTFEKLDAFNKSSEDCKFIELRLGLREDSDEGFLSDKLDAILTAIAELSIKISDELEINYFFPRLYDIRQPEETKRMIESCVMLQDFIHIHCTQRMKITRRIEWYELDYFVGYPDMDSRKTSEQFVEELEVKWSNEISQWMQNPQYLAKFQTSQIFTFESGHIKLLPIETRISTYRSRFPKLKWERGEYEIPVNIFETGSDVNADLQSTDERHHAFDFTQESLELPPNMPNSDLKFQLYGNLNVVIQHFFTQKSILKMLQLSQVQMQANDADKLSISLATAVEKLKNGQYQVQPVSDVIPELLSEDEVVTIGKELEADYPLCSIVLYRVACLTHQSKTVKPEETLNWLSERVCDFEFVAQVIMDSDCEDKLRLTVIPIILKFVEDILHDLRAVKDVNLHTKAMFEVDCIVRLSRISIDLSRIDGTILNSSIIDLCREGMICLENQFGTAVHKCSYYGLLLNNISECYVKLGRPAQARYYFEKTLFVKNATAYGNREIMLQDLKETEDRNVYADKEESTSTEMQVNMEYSKYDETALESKPDIKSLLQTRTPLRKALQNSLDQLQANEALTLGDALVSGIEKMKIGEYDSAVQKVELAIPERISAADVISIGMKLTEEHPLCSIVLYRAASLLYLSKSFEPEDAVKWLNDRVSGLKKITETVKDSDFEDKFRLIVSDAVLKFEQDLVQDLLDIKNVNMNAKALFVADSIFSLYTVYIDGLEISQISKKSSPIIDLYEKGIQCLESSFGVAVNKCSYYGLLLNAIGECHVLLDKFDEATEYLQNALFAKYRTAYGSQKVRSMELRMTEDLIIKCKGGIDFDKDKIFVPEKSIGTFLPKVEPAIKSEQGWIRSEQDTYIMQTTKKIVKMEYSTSGKIIPKREPSSIKSESYSANSRIASTTTSSSTTKYRRLDTPKLEPDMKQSVIKMEKRESSSGFPVDSHNITAKMEIDEKCPNEDINTDNKGQTFEAYRDFDKDFDASMDNNASIDLSEKLTVSTQSKTDLPFKVNEINPHNCFGIVVLAKRAADADLFRVGNKYIMENLETISMSEAFKSLDIYHLKTYLENCDLSDTTRLDLIEAKLSISESILLSDDEIQKSDPSFVNLLASISTNHRNTYPKVRTYCTVALRRSLSDCNCLETAIFAANCRMDELQIWAEHYVIANFHSVSVTRYAEKVVSKFSQISSIPVRMLEVLKEQSGPSYDMSALEEISSEWLLKQLRKLSSVKTKTIGVEGGVIELDGCSVTFPEGSVGKDTKFTMSVNTDPRNYPENGKPITPILCVEPSIVFNKQVKVKLPTCISARDGKTLTVQLMSNHGSGWELDRDVELGSAYEISFEVFHFSDDVVAGQDTSNGRCRLLNDIYIQIKTGMITSYFYCFEKEEKDLKRAMRAKNCSSFSTTTLSIEGNENDDIKLNIDLDEPGEINLSYDRWLPKPVTMGKAREVGPYSFSVNPGRPVKSLPSESFVSGEYQVTLGPSNEPVDSIWVEREWPVTLDPERIEAPGQLIARTYVAGGVVNEHNEQCRTVVAGGVQKTTDEE